MRITIHLEDDLVRAVKQYAKGRSVSTGKAASDLLRRGLGADAAMRVVNGIYVVDLPEHSPRVTSETVRRS